LAAVIIDILYCQGAGALEEWTDADGKTCKDFVHGKMPDFMVIVVTMSSFVTHLETF
jgi:hypothetical protein